MAWAGSCLTTEGRSAVVDMSLSCSRSTGIGRGGRTTADGRGRSAPAGHRLRRLDVEGGDPAQLATVPRVVEGGRAGPGGAGVPDGQAAPAAARRRSLHVACVSQTPGGPPPPLMAVDEARPGGVLDQVTQQQATLRDRPVD